MSNDPTPAEVERAKRWAANNSVTVEASKHCDCTWFIRGGPTWFQSAMPNWIQDDEGAAWSALALALRHVFSSIGPVIEAEVHERWERAVGHGITTAEELASIE